MHRDCYHLMSWSDQTCHLQTLERLVIGDLGLTELFPVCQAHLVLLIPRMDAQRTPTKTRSYSCDNLMNRDPWPKMLLEFDLTWNYNEYKYRSSALLGAGLAQCVSLSQSSSCLCTILFTSLYNNKEDSKIFSPNDLQCKTTDATFLRRLNQERFTGAWSSNIKLQEPTRLVTLSPRHKTTISWLSHQEFVKKWKQVNKRRKRKED